MNKRKINNYDDKKSSYATKQIKVTKSQEDKFYESIKQERIERNVNQYYEESKFRLIPVIIIGTILASPFIVIQNLYNFCKNKKIIHPEIEEKEL